MLHLEAVRLSAPEASPVDRAHRILNSSDVQRGGSCSLTYCQQNEGHGADYACCQPHCSNNWHTKGTHSLSELPRVNKALSVAFLSGHTK